MLILHLSFKANANIDSCNYSISGKILDVDTKKPIPFATIKVKGESKFTTSNLEGEFKIDNLCSEENTLIISCMGYCDTLCTHDHKHGHASHFYMTQKVLKLDEVVIEAEQLKSEGTASMSQTLIKKEELISSPSQSLANSIAGVEGVTFSSAGTNVQLPIIHGLYGNRILVLNNGLKHGFQNWSNDHAPEIDVTSANSITVLKGASGVQFGPEALGGAIIVETNPMHLNEPLTVSLGTAYETNGRAYSGFPGFISDRESFERPSEFLNATGNIMINQGFKKWSYYLNRNYTKAGDRHTPDYSLTNSGKEEESFSTGLRFHHKQFDLKMQYSYVHQNLAFLRTSIASTASSFTKSIKSEEPVFIRPFSYEINNPSQMTTHHFAKAELSWWYSEYGKLTFKAGRQTNHRREFDVRRNSERPIINLDLNTSDYQLEWKHSSKSHLDGLVGLQYFEQENLNNPGTYTTAFIPNYVTRRWSAFIIESKELGKNTIELGLRIDAENNYIAGRETSQALFLDEFNFNNITASIGVVRKISDKVSFRSNLGSAWRTPNMAELYSFGQHGFKSQFGLLRHYYNSEGNLRTNRVLKFSESDIEVEKGIKFINELEINKDKNRHVITAYANYIENFIFDRPFAVIGTIRGPMPVFIFDQANALFVGIDYSWKREINKSLSHKYGLSYLYSRNIELNEPLINQPPIQLNYELKWKKKDFWRFESTSISLVPTYTFQQFQAPRTVTPTELIERDVIINAQSEIFDFTDAPDGYFLLAIAWNFEWNRFSGGIRIENALNTAYRDYLNEMRYFADEVGRNVIFNLNYTFKSEKNKN